jgi:hypothetical protein
MNPITLNEEAWQFACDDANNKAKKAQPLDKQSAFIPETVDDYAKRIIAGWEATYLKRKSSEHDALIAAASPEDKARIAKILSAPKEVQDRFAAQVDSLPS